MPYKVTNVSLEHQHALKRRMASRIQMEPIIAGKRLLLRQSITLTDEQYNINKDILVQCLRDGTVTVEPTMPFVPLKMPEALEYKVRGIPVEGVAFDEVMEFPEEEVVVPAPPIIESSVPSMGPTASKPITTQTNSPPLGGNYHQQRRDDKKRGGR